MFGEYLTENDAHATLLLKLLIYLFTIDFTYVITIDWINSRSVSYENIQYF